MGATSSSSSSNYSSQTGLLSTVTVGEILLLNENQNVITVNGYDILGNALKVLHEHRILSAPVLDKNGTCTQGFFAMDDVIIHLARVCRQSIVTGGVVSSSSIKTDQIEDMNVRRKCFHQETVDDVIGRHRAHSKLLVITKNKPFLRALHVFAVGVQRIVVMKSKKIVGVLTQSAVIKWFSQDLSRLGSLQYQNAAALGIAWDRVIKINKDLPAIDAVELMHEKCVFCLPLVDNDGKLFAHLSMSDFKSLILVEEDFHDLLLPVHVFVTRYHQITNKSTEIISAPSTATIQDVVAILAKERVHQVYLVNENGIPTNVISMTNVCHRIFSHHNEQGNETL